jgi:uncharacterized protein (TIGR03382 family)
MLGTGLRGFIATAACALAAAATMSAMADGPNVTLGITADGNNQSQNLIGTSTATPDVFNYQGNVLDGAGAWTLGWNFNASNNQGGNKAFTAGNYVIQNLSNNAIAFNLTISLPVALLGSTVYGGSVSGGLTTTGPGFISSIDGPLWVGSTGASTIGTLYNNPFNVTRTDPGSSSLGFDSFGAPIPSLPGPNLGSDLKITFSFLLGANSSASFTSVFIAQIPAPGAAALLGLAGLAGVGRRRRA